MVKAATKTKFATWDLTPLFKSDTDPRIQHNLQATEKAVLQFVTKWESRTDYLGNSNVLLQALSEFDELNRHFGLGGDVSYYFELRSSQDENDPFLKAQVNKLDDFTTKLRNKIHFFELRLGKITAVQQRQFLADSELKLYRHFLEKLFARAKFQLSEAEEKIMNLKSTPAYASWVRMTSSFLAKETRRGKTVTRLLADFRNLNKKVRDVAWKDVNSIIDMYVEVAENEMNALLNDKKINDELRGLTRPDTGRHLADDIDSEVVDAMTTAVTAKFAIAHRYYQFKAKVLGQSQLKYHERNIPLGKVLQEFPFAKTISLVRKVFNQLDPDFGIILDRFNTNGQLDVYPRVGKRGGAFCDVDLMVHPTYILLNHTDKLTDVMTLAHEMGHGINNELMKAQTSSLNFGSPLSIAEVASTFMEDFVLQELVKQSSLEQQLTLNTQKLDDDIATIFRQVAAYNFEKELHQEFRRVGYLSKDQIGKLFSKHMAAYMGPAVEQTPGCENFWVYWSHFRNYFYVYSYASGLIISKSLQAKVKQDPKFITSVKQILAVGTVDSPKDIFKKYAGIDIADPKFWTTGLDEVESLLTKTEKLYNQLQKGKH